VDLLVQQGYPTIARFNDAADRQMRWANRHLPLWTLAETAALEHLTAIMARRGLSDPDYWASPMHEDMAPIWQWHAMEEAEHKSVAFDVFQQVSGSYPLRIVAMIAATLGLAFDNFIRWVYFTKRDGNLGKLKLWRDTWSFVMGSKGLYRQLIPDYVRWFRRDFHPDQQDDTALIEACQARLAGQLAT
jgi:predicted metal-dependent hydrolase